MGLAKWDLGTMKMTDSDLTITAATRGEVRSAMYCPQNAWARMDFGVDGKVAFAHLKEGHDGQLAGLTSMLEAIIGHKSADKTNVFACGSPGATNSDINFRKKISKTIKAAGIKNWDQRYGSYQDCMAWLVVLKQLNKTITIGTAGITTCIGVIAWSPNTCDFGIKSIDSGLLANLEGVELQSPGDEALSEVNLDDYKVPEGV
ncbi:MAG: hypothetical protein ACI841_000090 [Planctomycetota bacterium]|jgi:hypothetical protein